MTSLEIPAIPIPATTAPVAHEARPRAKWTGVLFVHGMGSQRRFGDVSALVEALDRRARTDGQGEFLDIDVKLEPARHPDAPPVTYLEARWEHQAPGLHAFKPYRFYESYWAPITAGGVPTLDVIKWLFAQVAKPLGSFVTAWREKARLRRAILLGLSGVNPRDLTTLFEAYDEYEGQPARDAHRSERFRGFLDYLRAGGHQAGIPDSDRERLVAIARRWHRACVRGEAGNLLVLVTIAAALLVVTGLIALTATGLIALREGATLHGRSPLDFARYIKDHKATFAMLGSTALLLPGLGSGLRDYLGDVVFWTTYEETQTRYDKRRQILAEVRACLAHLVNHPDCERIVVVAHSLGTAIAVDAILAEARDARALQGAAFSEQLLNQRKITHVVTYGSPIDKIHYFFERDPGQHRYHRVVEDLRGDIGTEPFGNNNGRPWIHWLNFWDRADFISGTLESPANRIHPNLRVDNVEVSGGVLLNPVRAHTHYLDRPAVLDALLEVILRRRTGHRVLERTIPVATGNPRRWATPQLVGAMTFVWLLVGTLAYCIATVSIGLAAGITLGLAGLVIIPTLIGAASTLGAKLALAFEWLRALLRL